jgi:hypothetical protein
MDLMTEGWISELQNGSIIYLICKTKGKWPEKSEQNFRNLQDNNETSNIHLIPEGEEKEY